MPVILTWREERKFQILLINSYIKQYYVKKHSAQISKR